MFFLNIFFFNSQSTAIARNRTGIYISSFVSKTTAIIISQNIDIPWRGTLYISAPKWKASFNLRKNQSRLFYPFSRIFISHFVSQQDNYLTRVILCNANYNCNILPFDRKTDVTDVVVYLGERITSPNQCNFKLQWLRCQSDLCNWSNDKRVSSSIMQRPGLQFVTLLLSSLMVIRISVSGTSSRTLQTLLRQISFEHPITQISSFIMTKWSSLSFAMISLDYDARRLKDYFMSIG